MQNDECGQNFTPINPLHATAMMLQIVKPMHGRNNITLLNIYNSLNSVKDTEQQINKSLKYIYNSTKDNSPNLVIGRDMSMWSKLIGSELKNCTSYPDKFKRGDNIMHTLAAHGATNLNSDELTL